MEKVLLSICIPTYNRAKNLKQCLDNIVCQFNNENIKNIVEIVVSDNASEDNTPEIVKEYQKKHENIKYYRNERNLGLDENVINSVVKSQGKYCWHIGDDDFMQNGAIELVLDILSKKDVALLTINFYPFIDIEKSLKRADFDISLVEYYLSAEEFYKKGYSQGILSLFIFNKELWMKTDRSNYEKHWSYYEIILRMMGNSPLPFAYTQHKLVYNGQDYKWNEGGTALFVLIHIKRFMIKLDKYGYSKQFVKNEMNRLAGELPKTLLSAKSYDLPLSFENLKLIYNEFKNYPFKLFLATIIFFVPNSIIKYIKKTKRHV